MKRTKAEKSARSTPSVNTDVVTAHSATTIATNTSAIGNARRDAASARHVSIRTETREDNPPIFCTDMSALRHFVLRASHIRLGTPSSHTL
jgi:hypothetical protein